MDESVYILVYVKFMVDKEEGVVNGIWNCFIVMVVWKLWVLEGIFYDSYVCVDCEIMCCIYVYSYLFCFYCCEFIECSYLVRFYMGFGKNNYCIEGWFD